MCQTTDADVEQVENGRRDSDIRPKYRDEATSKTGGGTFRKSVMPPKLKGIYMDEAITMTGFGFFNYVVIFLSGLILNAVLMETCGISFIIPVSQCDLNLTAGEKGILSAVCFFGIICSSHLWGYLADTKGRRKVILPTLFIAFLLSVASSLVQNFYLFATLRFLNGFFISGSSATIYAYLSEFHNNAKRSRAIMGSAVIFGISCFLLPLIAWLVVNQDWQFDIPLIGITYKPWRFFLVVCGIPGFVSSIILLFLPESPKFALGQGDTESVFKVLEQMNCWNNGRKAELDEFELYEEEESIENRRRILEAKESRFPLLKSVWIQTAPLFKPPHLGPTILICTIQFGLYATCNGFYMFFADILNRMATNLDGLENPRMSMCSIYNMQNNNTDYEIFDFLEEEICITKLELATLERGVAMEIVFAIGLTIIGVFISKVGKFPILIITALLCGSGGIVCMLTDNPTIQIYALILLMCSGWGVNVVNASCVEIYPTALRAMAICISLMFGRLGSVFGANIAALLLENHCETVFYLSGSSVIVMGILTFFIPNIHKKVERGPPTMHNEPRMSIISFR